MSEPASPLPVWPMTFGQLLDRTYRITRANFRTFLAIAFVPSAICIVVVVAIEASVFYPLFRHFPAPPSQESLAQLATFMKPAILIPAFLLLTILNGVMFALYFAAAIHAATRADRGLPTSFREAWQAAFTRTGTYVWLMVLLYLVVFLPAVIVESVFFGAASLLATGKTVPNPAVFLLFPLGMLLFFAALAYAIVISLRLSLAFPACVVEGIPARAALKRSSFLTQGAKGRIFLVMLVEYAILYVAIMIGEIVLMILAALGYLLWSALDIHLAPPLSYIAIGCGIFFLALVITLWTALTWAGFTSALAVIYRDQCLRRDLPPPTPQPSGAPA